MKRTQMRLMSDRRRAELAEAGITHPTSTLVSKRAPEKPKRQAYTGPKKSVTELVDDRSGGLCEWTDCGQPQTERHHRLNRKNGGRHGEAKERVNGTAWLLGACRVHHAFVTSPYGHRLKVARDRGWLLHENEDATQVPVWTRHSDQPVYLTADGLWVRFEEACA